MREPDVNAKPQGARVPKPGRADVSDNDKNSGESLPLFLSLFLLMLAFFLVLNSLSKLEGGQGDEVMASVQAAFPNDASSGTLGGLEREDSLTGTGMRLTRVAEAFDTVLGGDSVVLRQDTDQLVLEVVADRLFNAGTAEFSPAGDGLLRRLLPILRASDKVLAISVAIYTGLKDGEALALAPPRVRQAAAIAGGLQAGGLVGRHVEIAAYRATSSRLRLIFNVAERRRGAS